MERVWNIVTDILSLLFVLAVFGFLGYRSLQKSEEPGNLIGRWIITAGIAGLGFWILRSCPEPFVPVAGAALGAMMAVVWTGTIARTFADPIGGMFDGGKTEVEPKPLYSYAETKRQKGLPVEAIVAVRTELAKFPDDLTGVLLMASIQAVDLKDLEAAEGSINGFLAQLERPPQTVAAALQNLADLQLRAGKGAAAASETLRRITEAYPGTPYAHGALQRIAHFEGADAVRFQRTEGRFDVPEGERDVGLREGVKTMPKADGPFEEIDRLVGQLERHPADVDSREKLATLYAQELGRIDLAVEQLEQLIALRAESPRRIGAWLNLLATVHARFGDDFPSAEAALRRIIERFPKSGMADAAETRLASLKIEMKGNHETALKALGSYEKQMGLKRSYGAADPASV